jgi:hypothetical protein
MHQRSFPTALTVLCFVASVGARASATEPRPTPEARAHFKAAVEHLDAERYEDAYRELKAAYAISPSPKVLGNIGIATEHLQRDGEAIEAYQGYLDAGALSAREAALVRRSLDRLRAGVATVTLEAPGQFWIVDTRTDGARVVNEYGPFTNQVKLQLRAGQHELELARASFRAPAWRATLLAGDAAKHSFEKVEEAPLAIVERLGPEPAGQGTTVETDVSPPSHTVSYVLWGAGAAAGIAATVFLLEAGSTQNDADDEFERRCPLGAGVDGCENTTDGDQKAARWRTAALVTGVGAVGAIAGGAVLYLLDSSSPAGGATEASVQPWISPRATGVFVSGAF